MTDAERAEGWKRHDGGLNPAPDRLVDLVWGIGIIERQLDLAAEAFAERVPWFDEPEGEG